MSERRVAGRQVFTAGTQPLSFSAQETTSVPPLWLQAFLPAGLSSSGMGVLAWQLTVTRAQKLSILERMVLASHEAYAWLENQVHGVERVTLGVQPQRPRESVPVLRSEQVTVFSGLQPGFLPDVYDTRFPCALDWRGEFRNEQTIPSPSCFYFQTPRPGCGRARAALRSCLCQRPQRAVSSL